MATSEEKQETVDTLKGPRYYRVTLWGYGGESAYINVNKATYDFWSNITEKFGDNDLVNYMLNAEDGDWEFEDIEEVPADAKFMEDEDGGRPWYEANGEYCHQYGVEYGSARLSVDEIKSDIYNASIIASVIDGEEVVELNDAVREASDYTIEPCDHGEYDTFEPEGDYIIQMYSSEKGTFFDAVIETIGDFDIRKLEFVVNEYPNGEDIIDGLRYNGVDLENNGGETSGKGYSAHIWSNVE